MSIRDKEQLDVGVKEAIEKIKSGFNEIFSRVFQMDLDDITKLHTDKIDEVILRSEKNKDVTFVGGVFTITYVNEKTFSITVVLYYRDKHGDFIEEKAVTPRSTKCLKPYAIDELRQKKKIEYSIDEPVRKNVEKEDFL